MNESNASIASCPAHARVCTAQTPSSSGKHVHHLLLLQNETKILKKAESQGSDMEANVTVVQSPEAPKTTDSISQKPHPPLFPHHQRHLQNVQWTLTFIGWGSLIVIGVIVARYFRRFPMECDEWYSVHALCQTVGYLVGIIGWCLSMLLGPSSKHYSSKTQRILNIIAFTFLSLQMLSIFVRTKKEGYIKWWSICHKSLGYAIVAIIIANNILEGINYQSERGGKLNLVSVAILALLLLIAFSLEIFRCIKSRLFIL
ncbi:hypothetical protein K1719_000890 [Acacia pycnantha]|nr:hypothetical protein K1719_000890 [Acacia pycnantha]